MMPFRSLPVFALSAVLTLRLSLLAENQPAAQEEAAQKVAGLLSVIRDDKKDATERRNAIYALRSGKLRQSVSPAIPALAELLDHPDGNLRGPARDVLGQLGAVSIPALREAMVDEKRGREAALAFHRMGAPAAEPLC